MSLALYLSRVRSSEVSGGSQADLHASTNRDGSLRVVRL